jgi:Mg2+/citrate symporter
MDIFIEFWHISCALLACVAALLSSFKGFWFVMVPLLATVVCYGGLTKLAMNYYGKAVADSLQKMKDNRDSNEE